MKALKSTAFATLLVPAIVTLFCTPKAQAKNRCETEINQIKSTLLVSANNNQLTKNQLDQYWWGPNQDFKIWMPGFVICNEPRLLMSASNTSETVYMITHKDLPIETRYLPSRQIRELLQTSMREVMISRGKIVRSRNIEIRGYAGLELLVQHADGKTGQYQGVIVKGRAYLMEALTITEGELTTEAVNFFDSFQVYPERVR
ncbi:MAG: hypothetical protein ACFB2X_07300 [Rivularia sp. (in: cyanobacteria)]